MADPDPRDVPELDLPAPRASGPSAVNTSGARPVATSPSLDPAPGAIELGAADDFDMEIERGGAMVSLPPSLSGRPSAPVSGRPVSASGRPLAPGSGLDVSYRRMDAAKVASSGPALPHKILAWTIAAVLPAGTAGALAATAHRPGGRDLLGLMPHAFDASSTVESGALSLAALVLAIAIGFVGLKLRPRSYAMVTSGAMLLLASLAMVTVTLVSTEEHPTPPDGALLIPYVGPLAILLLGLGVAGRGPWLFLEGGARRAGAAFAGLCGGELVFTAVELSALASRLP